MSSFIISGPVKSLNGIPKLQGSKNATMPVIVASVLLSGETTLHNVPRLFDIDVLLEIVRDFGVKTTWIGNNTLKLNSTDTNNSYVLRKELTSCLRGSIYATVIAVKNAGCCSCGNIGGDEIEGRSLAAHSRAYQGFGLSFRQTETGWAIRGGSPIANDFELNDEGISASCIALLLASLCCETSIIRKISREPEVQILAEFLTEAGALVAIEDRTARVKGPLSKRNFTFVLPDDRIVVGTWAIATGLLGGYIKLRQSWATRQLLPVFTLLQHSGVKVSLSDSEIAIERDGAISSLNVTTGMYPEYPTDLLPQTIAMLALARGVSYVTEQVYKTRFQHVPQLHKLGASIEFISNHTIKIEGQSKLFASTIEGSGIRETAALLLAALAAQGRTTLSKATALHRGYERSFIDSLLLLSR